jgi:hypothetical protein
LRAWTTLRLPNLQRLYLRDDFSMQVPALNRRMVPSLTELTVPGNGFWLAPAHDPFASLPKLTRFAVECSIVPNRAYDWMRWVTHVEMRMRDRDATNRAMHALSQCPKLQAATLWLKSDLLPALEDAPAVSNIPLLELRVKVTRPEPDWSVLERFGSSHIDLHVEAAFGFFLDRSSLGFRGLSQCTVSRFTGSKLQVAPAGTLTSNAIPPL